MIRQKLGRKDPRSLLASCRSLVRSILVHFVHRLFVSFTLASHPLHSVPRNEGKEWREMKRRSERDVDRRTNRPVSFRRILCYHRPTVLYACRSFLSSFRPLATGSCPSLGVRRSGTRRERRGKGHGRWCGVVSPSHSVSSLFLCDVGGAWRARVAKAMNDPSHPLT